MPLNEHARALPTSSCGHDARMARALAATALPHHLSRSPGPPTLLKTNGALALTYHRGRGRRHAGRHSMRTSSYSAALIGK